jgi:hypothetical protein
VSITDSGKNYVIPDDATVRVRYKKPDNTYCYNDILGTDAGKSTAYIAVTQQMTACAGKAKFVVEIAVGETVACTSTCDVIIDKNPVQAGAIESKDEFKSVIELADEAKKSAEDAKTSETNAKLSEDNAKSSENASKVSENNVKNSEANASTSAENALESATNASKSATDASTSAINANTAETACKASQTACATSEANAKTYADQTQASLEKKQDKLTAGAGISIATDGTISVSYADGDTLAY